MVRALVVVVLLALLVAPGRADEPELVRHFLSDTTQEGDWSTCEAKISFEAPDPSQAALPERLLVTYRVKKVTHDHFEVAIETLPKHGAEWETRHYARGSKTLRELFKFGPEVTVSEVAQSEEDRTVDGKKFHCHRVQFTTTEGSLVQRNDLWLCPVMYGLRICALTTHVIAGPSERRVIVEMELRGFGRAGSKLWGKEAKELK
jgi:hypothetical protein